MLGEERPILAPDPCDECAFLDSQILPSPSAARAVSLPDATSASLYSAAMTDLSEVQDVWDSLARHDPMRAILDAPGRANHEPNAWTVEEFLATGEQTVDHVLGLATLAGLPVRFGSALDFGCGVGRLSLALATRFESVVGVDIAEGMLDAARRLDAEHRVQFVLNDEPDLGS